MPKNKHNPGKAKTYAEVARILEKQKGTMDQRIAKSRTVRKTRAKSYEDPGVVKRTAIRLKKLFRGPKTKFAPTFHRKRFEAQKAKEARTKPSATVRTTDVSGGLKRAGLTKKEIKRLK